MSKRSIEAVKDENATFAPSAKKSRLCIEKVVRRGENCAKLFYQGIRDQYNISFGFQGGNSALTLQTRGRFLDRISSLRKDMDEISGEMEK